MSRNDHGPISIIQKKLQQKRTERDQNISDIESLQQEKRCIQKLLPKIFYELSQSRENILLKKNELIVFDNAIEEIEKHYGSFLYTADFYSGDQHYDK